MKNNMWRRSALVLMVITMIASITLAGCSSSNNETSSTPGSDTSVTTPTPQSEAPKERVTLRVTVWDRGNTPAGFTITDNLMTRWIQENFGEPNNINVEYIPIPRSEEISSLNVLMAAQSAPDVIISYNRGAMYNFVRQGGLHELGPIVDQYGPTIKDFMASSLSGGYFDGKMYTINNPRINLQKYNSFIRQDWLDQLGLPVPTTTEQTYNTLVAFKNAKLGGDRTVPLAFSLAPSSYEPIIWSFIKETSNEARFLKSVTIGSREYPILADGHKDGVQFLNKLYNEGLMEPDFALDKDQKKRDESVVNGYAGMHSENSGGFYAGGGNSRAAVLAGNVSGALMVPALPWTNFEGKNRQPAYTPFGFHIGVPIFSKRAEEAVKFINWMSERENWWYITFGAEGVNHDLVNGFPIVRDDDATKALLYNAGDMRLISNGVDFGGVEANIEQASLNALDEYRELSKTSRAMANKDAVAQPIQFSGVLESEAKYAVVMLDKYYELLVKSIMARPADFDRAYEAALKDFMDTAGNEVIAERKMNYEAGNHDWQY